jgi:hypothetical protein
MLMTAMRDFLITGKDFIVGTAQAGMALFTALMT